MTGHRNRKVAASDLRLWPAGGGMAALIRTHDWAGTPLGAPEGWPQPLRTAVEMALAGRHPACVTWSAARALIYNDGYAGILGPRHPGALGKPFLDVWRDLRERIEPLLDHAYAGEAASSDDITVALDRHGVMEEARFTFSLIPVRDEAGNVAGTFCTCLETTAAVRAERARSERETWLRSVLDSMQDGFVLLDRDFRALDMNAAAERLGGRTRAEVLGLTHWEAWPASVGSPLEAAYRRAMAERASVRLEYRFPADGRDAWLDITAQPVPEGLAIFCRDITERRRAEAALRESEERFRNLANAVPAFVWFTDPEGRVTFSNERWHAYTGITDEDPETWPDIVFHPDERGPSRAAWLRGLRAGSAFEIEARIRRRDGEHRWFLTRAVPVRDAEGRIAAWFGASIDIHDRKLAEEALRAVRDEAVRARAVAEEADRAKSQFLTMVSHDLRQPVTAANLFLNLLRKRDLDPAARELFESLAETIEGLNRMLTGLLDVARLEAGLLRPRILEFPLDDLLQKLQAEFEGLARAAGLGFDVSPAFLSVRSDPLLVEMILRNLISNAVKYTRTGSVTVMARAEGGTVVIDVADTGPGIAAENLGRIFEEYFRSGDAGDHSRGFGIGLGTVRRVSALLGTRVEVRSEIGRGSTFTLPLPLAAGRGRTVGSAGETGRGLLGRSAVIVDDEPMVLKALGLMLRFWGMQTHRVHTVAQVEALLDRLERPPDVIVADYTLAHGERGTDAVAAARRHGVRRAVLLTGDTAPERLADARRSGCRVLHKPIDADELEALLGELMDASE